MATSGFCEHTLALTAFLPFPCNVNTLHSQFTALCCNNKGSFPYFATIVRPTHNDHDYYAWAKSSATLLRMAGVLYTMVSCNPLPEAPFTNRVVNIYLDLTLSIIHTRCCLLMRVTPAIIGYIKVNSCNSWPRVRPLCVYAL